MLIWQTFKHHITENNLVVSGDKILLAVSGGADSIAMADLFHRLKKIIDIDLILINFNHNLRKESINETKLVENFAKKYKIKFISKTLDTKQFALKNNISIETAGRQLRYFNLENIAKTERCNKIATAHNMNDQAETILMWLTRGTGTDGLVGIPILRKLNKNLLIIRPLLAISRELIEAYTKKQKLKYCTDKSNFSQDFTRNKIRLNVLPELKKINPLVMEHIFELSKISTRENLYFDKKTSNFILKNTKTSKNKIIVNLESFLNCDKALRHRILKNILPVKKSSGHINGILKWMDDEKTQNYMLDKQWIVKKNAGRIFFIKK
ncbi:MAG: tRNA lysidine(34) synthetase TilS [Endomicrobiaceae bacterium]|nr:tRNA lysidine(34) synthetase TilS [Endomicrobiaceae bacterium]